MYSIQQSELPPRLPIERFRRFLGTLSITPGLVSVQTALRAEGSEDEFIRELALRYPMRSARNYWNFKDTAGVGRRAMLAAAESAHRITEAAVSCGHEDTHGMVYAVRDCVLLRIGSPSAPGVQAMDNRVPAIVERLNAQLAADDLPIQFGLTTQATA